MILFKHLDGLERVNHWLTSSIVALIRKSRCVREACWLAVAT
jgi:hypothetical protein